MGEHDVPFQTHTCILEDPAVEHGGVERGKDGDEDGNNGLEEKLIGPDVNGPLREVFLRQC